MRRNILGGMLFVMASLVAFGQTATPSDAQEHKELQQIDRNAAQQKQNCTHRPSRLSAGQSRLAQRGEELKNGDMAAANKEQRKARQAKNDLSQEQQNTIGIREWRVRFEPTLPRGAHR